MPSLREQVLDAVEAMIRAALPSATVGRNLNQPETIGRDGFVSIQDGDPGEPEVTLSPPTFSYAHIVPLEVAVEALTVEGRTAALDGLLMRIGARCEQDRTLGGLAEWLEPQAPTTADLEPGDSTRWADAALIVHYSTTNPFT